MMVAMMGDTLDVADGQDVQVTASWAGCPEGAELCLVADGKPKVTIPAGNADARTWKLDGGGTQWCLLTLRGAEWCDAGADEPDILRRADAVRRQRLKSPLLLRDFL